MGHPKRFTGLSERMTHRLLGAWRQFWGMSWSLKGTIAGGWALVVPLVVVLAIVLSNGGSGDSESFVDQTTALPTTTTARTATPKPTSTALEVSPVAASPTAVVLAPATLPTAQPPRVASTPAPEPPAGNPAQAPEPTLQSQPTQTPVPTPTPLRTSIYWLDMRGEVVGYIYHHNIVCQEKNFIYSGFELNCSAISEGWTISCKADRRSLNCLHSQEGSIICSYRSEGETTCLAPSWTGTCNGDDSNKTCTRSDLNGTESVTCQWIGLSTTCDWHSKSAFGCARGDMGSGTLSWTCQDS